MPRLAAGVELLGPMAGSGYRNPPHLLRRGDGQIVQVTPLLAAIAAAIDGHRDLEAVAAHVEEGSGRVLHPDDIAHLVDAKLRPLGLLARADGRDPEVTRSQPLLGLRGRIVVTSPGRTDRLARPFLWLFRPAVVGLVLAAFTVVSVWALLDRGLSTAVAEALEDPALLLVLIGLIVASGAFHEIGHAAACRYGGARPGVMGAAVYLVWPAFYTDVTDSYRLDRVGRLRVDLGGLYFNAVFTVATALAWAVTGTEALLLLVPVQLLQMARQLVPVVRFDGYHILADLVGVPDLFTHLRPTLVRAIPWRRTTTPNPLTPRAQAVVVTWVVIVVPFLAVSLGLLLWNLPGVMRAAAGSLSTQAELLRRNADDGRLAATALGVVAMATVAFFPLSATYLFARLAHRSGRRFWQATEQRPALRLAACGVAAAVLLSAAPGLLPRGDGRTDPDLAGASLPVAAGEATELALAAPASESWTSPEATTAPPPEPAAEPAPTDEAVPQPAPAPDVAPEPAAASVAPVDPWPFPFPEPDRPSAGDNQAAAVAVADGTHPFQLRTSLEWVTDGGMRNANEAWALAACRDCSARAVAFQIVAAIGDTPTAVPENIAIAYNHEGCERCRTTAVAVQLAVTLAEEPSESVKADLQRILDSVRAREAAYETADPAVIRAELRAAEAEALAALEPWLAEEDDGSTEPDDAEAAADETSEGTGEETSDPTAATPGDGTTVEAPDEATAPAEEPMDPGGTEPTTTPTEPEEKEGSSTGSEAVAPEEEPAEPVEPVEPVEPAGEEVPSDDTATTEGTDEATTEETAPAA